MSKQEIGETSKAIIEDDEKIIQKIVDENKHRTDPYWIVIFAKKAPVEVNGKPTLTKLIKPYFKYRPRSLLGLIIGEVDNKKGTIDWEVNFHDVPFGYELLGLEETKPIAVDSKLGASYVYN